MAAAPRHHTLGSELNQRGTMKTYTIEPRRRAALCSRLGLATCTAARGVRTVRQCEGQQLVGNCISWGPAGCLRFRQLGGADFGSRVATRPALVGASNSRQAASAVVASQQSRFFPSAAGRLNAAARQLEPAGQLLQHLQNAFCAAPASLSDHSCLLYACATCLTDALLCVDVVRHDLHGSERR
jgi:hypothetical protein